MYGSDVDFVLAVALWLAVVLGAAWLVEAAADFISDFSNRFRR